MWEIIFIVDYELKIDYYLKVLNKGVYINMYEEVK